MFELQYEAKGIYETGNVFTAELSDEFGLFVNPNEIGSVVSTISSEIPCMIPNDLNQGASYKIRIKSSLPSQIIGENDQLLTILEKPGSPGTISGPTELFQEQTGVSYSVDPVPNALEYFWTLPEGATGSSSSNIITVDFNADAISGNISVFASNECGDSNESVLQLNIVSQQHFHPIWEGTSGQDHMNIRVFEAMLDGLNLEPGDEIGVFDGNLCVGFGRLNQLIDQQHLLSIVVSSDDGSGNGYTPGDDIKYIFWDSGTASEYVVKEINCYDNKFSLITCSPFEIGATAFVKLSAYSEICQKIALRTGWNIFSAPNVPEPSQMMDIFQSMIESKSLVKIQNEKGDALEDWGVFGGWQNNIGDIEPSEGYKIKVTRPDTIEICGIPVDYPFAIPLKTGWNIMGYPQTISYNAMDIVHQIRNMGSLIKVQDETGNAIEDWGVFGGWTNNIGDFNPGEGYKIKVSKNDTLWIHDNYLKSTSFLPASGKTIHFRTEYEGNGIDHMNINLVELPVNMLNPGDEIALFDGTTCAGALTITLNHLTTKTLSIIASANDENRMGGFKEGNPITLKLWNSQRNQEFILEPEILSGTSTFIKHETTFASLKKYAITGLESAVNSDLPVINCYPNPFSDEVTVEIILLEDAELEVAILNQLGQHIKNIANKQVLINGVHKLYWNGRNENNQKVSTGTYYLKVKAGDSVFHQKIIFSR